MRTGVKISKTRQALQMIAAVTGSVAVIGASVVFVTNDYKDMLMMPTYIMDDTVTIAALEPIRSDAQSEQNGDKDASFDDDIGTGIIPDKNNDDCMINVEKTDTDAADVSVEKPHINISMNKVNFKANSSEYVDKTAAEQVLRDYVTIFDEYFAEYPDGLIYLVGSVAKTMSQSETDVELSKQRADRVRQSFIDLGVDEARLIALGLGTNDPWREDEWKNGYFDETIAKDNRRVWIIPDTNEDQVALVLVISKAVG